MILNALKILGTVAWLSQASRGVTHLEFAPKIPCNITQCQFDFTEKISPHYNHSISVSPYENRCISSLPLTDSTHQVTALGECGQMRSERRGLPVADGNIYFQPEGESHPELYWEHHGRRGEIFTLHFDPKANLTITSCIFRAHCSIPFLERETKADPLDGICSYQFLVDVDWQECVLDVKALGVGFDFIGSEQIKLVVEDGSTLMKVFPVSGDEENGYEYLCKALDEIEILKNTTHMEIGFPVPKRFAHCAVVIHYRASDQKKRFWFKSSNAFCHESVMLPVAPDVAIVQQVFARRGNQQPIIDIKCDRPEMSLTILSKIKHV